MNKGELIMNFAMQLACDSLQGLGMLLLGLCLVPPPLPGKLNLSISTTGGLDGAELGIHMVTL